MERILILGIFTWGTVSDFAEAADVNQAVERLKHEGATEILVGQEAQRYQVLQGEVAWIQEMADHDPR